VKFGNIILKKIDIIFNHAFIVFNSIKYLA